MTAPTVRHFVLSAPIGAPTLFTFRQHLSKLTRLCAKSEPAVLRHSVALSALLALAACVEPPSPSASAPPIYVTAQRYDEMSCTQIAHTASLINQRAAYVASLSQPAEELDRLNGELDALERVAIRERCGILFPRRGPPN